MPKHFKFHHPGVITTLLLVFPPAAWYIMWKHEKYHSWFPKLLLFYTVPTLVIYVLQLLFLIPRLHANPTPIYWGMIFYISQIMFYFLMKKEFDKSKKLEHTFILITIGILSIDTLLPILINYSALFTTVFGK